MFLIALLWAIVALSSALVNADATSSSSPSSTSSAPASTLTISVGAQGLVFTPNQLTANVGDVIQFRFYPQNHSVARSEYKSPCIPYEDTGVGKVGFWSGFQPIAVVLNDPPTFEVMVNDTEPIFFYCSAPGACIDDGMVGVINANETETFETQQAFAKNSTLMFSPGQYWPSEVVPTTAPTTTPSPTGTTTITPSSIATGTVEANTTAKSSSPLLSPAAIAGISIAGAAVLIIAAALLYLCGRQKTMREIIDQQPPTSVSGSKYHSEHLSMTSSGTYPSKIPRYNSNSGRVRGASYSNNLDPRTYDRTPADTDSYRSRPGSPDLDDIRDTLLVLPIQQLPPPSPPPNTNTNRQNSRPTPESPGGRSTISAMTQVNLLSPINMLSPIDERALKREQGAAKRESQRPEVPVQVPGPLRYAQYLLSGGFRNRDSGADYERLPARRFEGEERDGGYVAGRVPLRRASEGSSGPPGYESYDGREYGNIQEHGEPHEGQGSGPHELSGGTPTPTGRARGGWNQGPGREHEFRTYGARGMI